MRILPVLSTTATKCGAPTRQKEINQQTSSPNIIHEESFSVAVPKRESWLKLRWCQKLLAIIQNEVTWGVFVIICCAISLAIIWVVHLPVQWQSYKDPTHEKGLIGIIGGIFTLVASFMSMTQIIQHFAHQTHRPSQKRIVRILAIIPVYGITAWISLLFFEAAIYMEFIQSCFEAYIIYCFFVLLTKYVGGHRGVEFVILSKQSIALTFPFGYCFRIKPKKRWAWYFKIGLLQYSCITPLCSAIAVVLNLANIYANGQWKLNRGYPYITFIINASQMLALYSLVTFYVNAKDALKPFTPLPKFIVIKLIVFFIFWQSVLMSGLATLKVLRNTSCDPTNDSSCHGSTTGFTVEQEKILLENILICVEMFFFSIAHHWVFSWRPYIDGSFKILMESRYQHLNKEGNESDPKINQTTSV